MIETEVVKQRVWSEPEKSLNSMMTSFEKYCYVKNGLDLVITIFCRLFIDLLFPIFDLGPLKLKYASEFSRLK